MEEELRKVRSDLVLSGVGVMLFGVWAFVKMILYCLFAKSYVNRLLELGGAEAEMRTVVILVWLFFAFISMVLYLYIGFCAFREGRSGLLRRRGYRFLAVLELLMGVYALISNGVAFFDGRMDVIELLSEVLLGVGSIGALWSLVRSTGRLRKLTKEEENISHAD